MKYHAAGWLVMLVLVSANALAQTFGDEKDHVSWRFSGLKQSGSEWKLVFTAVIDRGWHLYSQSTTEGGPMPVSFEFDPGKNYRLSGKVGEAGDLRKGYDEVFMVNVSWYEGSVIFSQLVKTKGKETVKGEISYSVCSEEMCIPGSVRFGLEVGD